MAPKSKKAPAGGPKGGEKDEKREDPLQAVVLTDSYETKFSPFTLERPRCLLPLANTPLIEYTLEFLASNGVEEVYLYCGNHTDQIEDYIQSSKWASETAPFALELIRSTSSSIGDAMRDLDQKQILTGDFICVYGDVVSNVRLEEPLAAHRARREKDKRAIMTILLRETAQSQRDAPVTSVRPIFVIDPEKDRCLHYEQLEPAQKSSRLHIEADILDEHGEVDLRGDLVDCGIDICTLEVLSQWSEGFDWETPRRGFLYGVLKDHELNNLTIHTHIVTDGYAARVRNLPAYDGISKDVVSRWTYPLCPDVNLLDDQSYQLGRHNVYQEDGVMLARSCEVRKLSILGRGTCVGDGTVISNSILGRRCVIGKRVRIEGAYIWDDVVIGDDTVVEKSIIASGALIGKKCKVSAGALVSYNVKVTDGMVLDSKANLTNSDRVLNDDDDDDETGPEVLVPYGAVYKAQHFSFSADSVSTLNSEAAESDDEVELSGPKRSSRSESFASIGSEESGESGMRAALKDFHHEAATSIYDALQKGEDANNVQLELKGLQLAANADMRQVRRAVAVAMMKHMATLVEGGSTPQQAAASTITPNKLLIQRCVLDQKETRKTESVEFLLFMQTDLVHRKQGSKILFHASFILSTQDLIEGDGFEQWWEDPRSSASEELSEVRAETERLVQTLIASDDDEESDEDDDDETDDE